MDKYFYYNGKQKDGPLTLEELKAITISPNTLLWKEGMTEWKPASEFIELTDILESTPPLLPHEINQLKKSKQASYPRESINNSITSRKLWSRWLVVSVILSTIYIIGGNIDERYNSIFPVYNTNWERNNPFLAALKGIGITFIVTAIITIIIGLIQGFKITDSETIGSTIQNSPTKDDKTNQSEILGMIALIVVGMIIIYFILGIKTK